MSENFSYLNEYISANNDCLDNLRGDLDAEQIKNMVYEMYANFLNLQDDLKDIRKELRAHYKVKETAIKKWMKERETEDEDEDETPAMEAVDEQEETPEVEDYTIPTLEREDNLDYDKQDKQDKPKKIKKPKKTMKQMIKDKAGED